MSWPNVRLGDICSPKQWKTLSKKQLATEGFPVFGANGQIGYAGNYTHEAPVILVGCRGSCGTVHVTPPRSYANGNAMALDDLDAACVDRNYLALYLRYRGFRDVVSGTSQPQIIRANIVKVPVPLPPLSEQKRIAAILDKADELRAKRREAIAELDKLVQAAFLDMFGDPVTNPKRWESAKVGNICHRITVGVVVKPASYYQEAGVPALRSLNIKPNRIDLSDLVYFSQRDNETTLKKTRLWAEDVVFVRSGQPGTAAVVPQKLDGINAIDILIATPNSSMVDPVYLCSFFNSQAGKNLVLGEKRGQIQQHFNVGSLKGAVIPLPSLNAQKRFSSFNAAAVEQKNRLEKNLIVLDELFSSLQNRAFNGWL